MSIGSGFKSYTGERRDARRSTFRATRFRRPTEEMRIPNARNGQSEIGSADRLTAVSVRAGTLSEIREKGVLTVSGGGTVAAVFYHEGRLYAVDNRCPHIGFPLSRGTCKDAILTCEWHYARFDLATGGTFDLIAGDVDTYPVEVREGDVWVKLGATLTDTEFAERWRNRLQEGIEQNIRLVCAKSVLALLTNSAAVALATLFQRRRPTVSVRGHLATRQAGETA